MVWERSEWCGTGVSGMGQEGVVWDEREWCSIHCVLSAW